MAVKCIAIGNRIMGDDGIGIKVAEELLPRFQQDNIQVVFGETDIDYALSKIEDGDFLFILDASYLKLNPGSVTITSIEGATKNHKFFSQHQASLIDLVKIYGKSVEGYVVGIEVKEIHFSLFLSDILQRKLPDICKEVYDFINRILRGINHA